MKSIKYIIILVVLAIIMNGFYVLNETEQAIITQFGQPIGNAIEDAGLHFKTPFIQKTHIFEKRVLEWDGNPTQIPTSDKKYLAVDSFARWRIVDPLKFYQTTGQERFAHSRLDDIISGTTRDVISLNDLIEIVRDTNHELVYSLESDSDLLNAAVQHIKLGRSAIADSILFLSKSKISEYGIELLDVKIKRVNYIEEVRSKIYERMISERQKIAAKYRSAGQGQAAEINGKRSRELDEINSEAYKQAQEIKGRADGEATQIYAKAYNKDPEFYKFMKTLSTYKETINKNNTLILSTDSEYYKYLIKTK